MDFFYAFAYFGFCYLWEKHYIEIQDHLTSISHKGGRNYGETIFMYLKQHLRYSRLALLLTLLLGVGNLNPAHAGVQQENQMPPLTGDRSVITVSYPVGNTIWTIPGPVEIRWLTQNIPENKNLKFYLIKDDVVTQELGVFRNTGFAEGIKLHKALQPGSNYRVMAIELFPADKNYVAKMATPFFTLIKAPRKNDSEVKTVTDKDQVRNMFDGRKVTYVQELIVHSDAISISLWDHGRQDNDVVSIYLNGEAVVSKYALTYRKEHFDLKLDPSKPNDLFLYAHNLGEFPPNTVAIEIVDGSESENIVLNSDLKSCEAVLIKVDD